MTYLDLTHTFMAQMPVYPGDTPPVLKQEGDFASDLCIHFELTSSMHVGTHVDAPLHMLAGGKKLSDFPVEHFIGKGFLLDGRGVALVDVNLLEGIDLQGAEMLLVHTGWSRKFRDADYYEGFPVLTNAFAEKVASLGLKMVILDTPSPDTAPYEVHKILLAADVLIVENATNFEYLEGKSFKIFALPPKFDWEGAPIRVVAEL